MTDPLKPCPLCGGPGCQTTADSVLCQDRFCLFSVGFVTHRCWQALPRRSDAAGLLADEIEETATAFNDFDCRYRGGRPDFVEEMRGWAARVRKLCAPATRGETQ